MMHPHEDVVYPLLAQHHHRDRAGMCSCRQQFLLNVGDYKTKKITAWIYKFAA